MKLFTPLIVGIATLVCACAQEQITVRRAQTPSITVVPPHLGARAPRVAATYNSVPVNRRVLALTFDDGPHPSLTPKLLDILRGQGVRATFFVTGQNVKRYPEIARRIVSEGHEIANHTWSHPNLTQLGSTSLRREMDKTTEAIVQATERKPIIMRPPYGAINSRVRQVMLRDYDFDVIMWSVDPEDWRRPGPSVIRKRLVDGATPGGILLAHDIQPGTIKAMPQTITDLKAQGYGFVTVSQLVAMKKKEISPEPAIVASPVRN